MTLLHLQNIELHRVNTSRQYPLLVGHGKWMGWSFRRDGKSQGPVSQQVWHYKDPFLLKDRPSAPTKTSILQPSTESMTTSHESILVINKHVACSNRSSVSDETAITKVLCQAGMEPLLKEGGSIFSTSSEIPDPHLLEMFWKVTFKGRPRNSLMSPFSQKIKIA